MSAAFIAHIGHRGEVGLPGALSCNSRFPAYAESFAAGVSARMLSVSLLSCS